jgi:cytochrome P450
LDPVQTSAGKNQTGNVPSIVLGKFHSKAEFSIYFRINVVTSYWGQNVLTVDGPEWRRHRRVIQPAFNSET